VNALYPWEAAIIGIVAGPVYHVTSHLVRKLRVDDALDACAGKLNYDYWCMVQQLYQGFSLAYIHYE